MPLQRIRRTGITLSGDDRGRSETNGVARDGMLNRSGNPWRFSPTDPQRRARHENIESSLYFPPQGPYGLTVGLKGSRRSHLYKLPRMSLGFATRTRGSRRASVPLAISERFPRGQRRTSKEEAPMKQEHLDEIVSVLKQLRATRPVEPGRERSLQRLEQMSWAGELAALETLWPTSPALVERYLDVLACILHDFPAANHAGPLRANRMSLALHDKPY